MRQIWTVRLAQQADQDYVEILTWTVKTFGEGQASTYAETMALAIEALAEGPDVLGARARDDIQPGIRTLHVGRQGRAGRHFVVFRVTGSDIDVLRLLHDSMDLPRHLPAANDHTP
ncbi:MAG: type II toxin-antitoxin system RelE/ParE family toxin [Alphaproteobacteria bacterium]|nr:type II toxin-antitoxin system RelE/ParE family toxin [Alphaproteobacteria bacterium]